MKDRLDHVKHTCQHYDWKEDIFAGNSTQKLVKLWVSEPHKLIYCDLPKTGSTTFKYLIAMRNVPELNMESQGKHPHVHNLHFLREHGVRPMTRYTVAQAQYLLENYHTFVVVRHPFARLLSAFGDKIYPGGPYVEHY
jgi:hypothetical protein